VSLADGLRKHFLRLVLASLLGIIAVTLIVSVLDVSRLWLIAGALTIGAVEITVVAMVSPPSAPQIESDEQPLPASGGPSAYA
jgi:hypothetical protein